MGKRTRITKRVAEEKPDKETVIAEQLVKMAKDLIAEEADAEADAAEPKFNEIKMSIKSKLSKFNKKGLLRKRIQAIKGLDAGNQLVSRMEVMEVFELVDKILSL